MKAVVSAVCTEKSSIANNGSKVSKRKDIENEEIQMYLTKLKDLVPFIPKNKKLSKLEVIQCVIDYICDLQSALEIPPVNAFDAAAAICQKKSQAAVSPRQPLGLRPSPNTILAPCEAPVLTSEALTPSERLSSC